MIVPSAFTSTTRLLPVSAMKTSPAASTVTPPGFFRAIECVPPAAPDGLPAKSLIVPAGVTWRISLLAVSAM